MFVSEELRASFKDKMRFSTLVESALLANVANLSTLPSISPYPVEISVLCLQGYHYGLKPVKSIIKQVSN